MLNQDQIQNFVTEVNEKRLKYHKEQFPSLEFDPIEFKVSRKYVKLVTGNTVWGFIAKENGELKGEPIREGDLLKPANWRTPAKHSRGNILDGTAKYGHYGPDYKTFNFRTFN